MSYSDPPSPEVSKTVIGESKLDTEWAALDYLIGPRVQFFHGRMLNMNHPATYFTTEDGTFMVTVEKVSRAVMFPRNGG